MTTTSDPRARLGPCTSIPFGAKVLHQWAALGEYDFVNVVEAPDDLTIAKLSVKLGARGSVQFSTLPLVPVEELLTSLESS